MALYAIPHPWDYHAGGALVIEAPNKPEALKRAKAFVAKQTSWNYQTPVEYDKITRIKGPVYVDGGCDC